MAPYGAPFTPRLLTECPDARPSPPLCPGPPDTSEEELRSLKLILGAFDPLSPLLSPTLQGLYHRAHFTDVKTAQKGEVISPVSGTAAQVWLQSPLHMTHIHTD